MQNIRIIPVDKASLPNARKLVNIVFPHQSPLERISLWLYGKRGSRIYRMLSGLVGADLLHFWIAVEEEGKALGISGLYQTRKDRHEALWLGWYGVHPDARGKGVGGLVLRHAIAEAKAKRVDFLRLYTSVSELIEGSADAQLVYEKYGFAVTSRKSFPAGFVADDKGMRVVRIEKIIRELRLV